MCALFTSTSNDLANKQAKINVTFDCTGVPHITGKKKNCFAINTEKK